MVMTSKKEYTDQEISEASAKLSARGLAARRKGRAKTRGFKANIVEKFNVSQSVRVINNVAAGQTVPDQQFKAAMYIVDKFVPSLKAVSVDVTSTPSLKRADLESQMLSIGLDPRHIWNTLADTPDNVPANVIEHGSQPARQNGTEGKK